MEIEGGAMDSAKRIVELEVQCDQLMEEKIKLKEGLVEIEGSAMDRARRIVELEVQCDQLMEEKIQLKEGLMEVKHKEEKMKEKYMNLKDKFDSEERKWKEEARKIREKCCQVEVQKKKRLKRSFEDRDGSITKLLEMSEVLERQDSGLEVDFKAKIAVETKKLKLEEKKNSGLNRKIQVLEKGKERMVAEISKLKKEKIDEAKRSLNVNKALEVEKKRLKEVEGKNIELVKRIGVLECAMVAEVSKLKKEKIDEAKRNSNVNKALEAEKKRLKVVECKNVELWKMIGVLERTKKTMQDKVSMLEREKSEEVKKILNEKRACEESKKEVVELVKRIEALEKEKRERDAKFSQANTEIGRILKEKTAAEAEKRACEEESKRMIMELNKKIEALKEVEEKREMEANFFQANTEKNAEIERILNEKMAAESEKWAIEEESKMMIMELTKRIEALEGGQGEEEREDEEEMEVEEEREVEVVEGEDPPPKPAASTSGAKAGGPSAPVRKNRYISHKPKPAASAAGAEAGCPSAPAGANRYEAQKGRDWNTFQQYLRSFKPPPMTCTGANVIVEFLKFLDQFGKTQVHVSDCPFFGQPNPPASCPCPFRQAWGSLDALVGRLRAAFEENGGRPDSNPFAARAVHIYLREVREAQCKARGISYAKKKHSTKN